MEDTLQIPRADVQARADSAARDRLGELFERHQRRLYALAIRLCRDPEEARDLVQDTFVRAARARRVPEDAEAAEAWLVRVLVNLTRDRWRRLRVRRERAQERPSMRPTVSPESGVVARETVRWALDRLSPRRRAVVVLRELEGRDTASVARLLGVRRATVRYHLMEGRRQLRELLGPEETP